MILYHHWMVFNNMSLVIDLIGQLNCHVIGSKTRKSCLVRFDPIYCSGHSTVSQFSLLFGL